MLGLQAEDGYYEQLCLKVRRKIFWASHRFRPISGGAFFPKRRPIFLYTPFAA
jgi:hypothetical protein